MKQRPNRALFLHSSAENMHKKLPAAEEIALQPEKTDGGIVGKPIYFFIFTA